MTKIAALLTSLVVLAHTTSAEPRPPPGRPDREESHPCFPSDLDTVGGNSDAALPPCVRQAKIMDACGISSSDGNLTAGEMQQCVCDGSFFEDAVGCGACLRYQELISGDDYDEGRSAISSASSAYCNGDETANLDSILSNVVATTGSFSGGWSPEESPTTTKPTAVSNYFTATADQQGPGLESLVTDRTLTGEAPTSEPSDVDDAAAGLSSIGLSGTLLLFGTMAALLLG